MSLFEIEAEGIKFLLDDDSHNYICALLEKMCLKAGPGKQTNPKPSPTVELSLEDAKKIKELHDVFLIFLKESDPTRYRYIEACYNEKHIKATVLSEAITKAESKWWGTSEIEKFREAESKEASVKNGVFYTKYPYVVNIGKPINFEKINNQAKGYNDGGLTNKTLAAESQGKEDLVEDEWERLNRLRGFKPTEDNPDIARLKTAVAGLENDRSNIFAVLNQIQSRYDKLEETVRKSNLSTHVRLGGINPQ